VDGAVRLEDEESRQRGRLLAGANGRVPLGLRFGLTGDFVYSSDDNVEALGTPGYRSQRDNYARATRAWTRPI